MLLLYCLPPGCFWGGQEEEEPPSAASSSSFILPSSLLTTHSSMSPLTICACLVRPLFSHPPVLLRFSLPDPFRRPSRLWSRRSMACRCASSYSLLYSHPPLPAPLLPLSLPPFFPPFGDPFPCFFLRFLSFVAATLGSISPFPSLISSRPSVGIGKDKPSGP